MKKVLIVEDNRRVAKLIQSYLEKEGYTATLAYDGAKAMREFHNNQLDLLILDIMLPEKSGLEIAKEVRKTSTVPIIMITAKSEENDKLKGLSIGADDYIVKPFSPKEMVARVNAIFRRVDFDIGQPVKHIEKIEYKGLLLIPERREVFYHNKAIDLTALQFNLLIILTNSPGQVFSRTMLLEKIDADEEIFERTIDAHIKNMRKAFGEPGKKDGLIKTVFGVGYKID